MNIVLVSDQEQPKLEVTEYINSTEFRLGTEC